MSKPLRSTIGLILLVSTVTVASCQSMIEVMSDKDNDVLVVK